MATARIEAAIRAIHAKKVRLRKAFDLLLSSSSSSSCPNTFSLRWEDVAAQISSIESSIDARFRELQAKEGAAHPPTSPPRAAEPSEPTPRPKLVSLCASMNADGLRNFIANYRRYRIPIHDEFLPALRSALDPAMLVLETIKETCTPKLREDRDWKSCISLLECVHALADAGSIEPFVIEKAKQLALKWKGKLFETDEEDSSAASTVLNLLLSYGLASEFEAGEVIDLFVRATCRQKTVELCWDLGRAEIVPGLIDILIEKGRQLDAVRLIDTFNLSGKYSTVPLLKAYVEKTVKDAEELMKGRYSGIKKKAILGMVCALKAVLASIEKHNLESEYPPHVVEEEITKLQQYKNTAWAPADRTHWNSKPQHFHQQQWKQQQQQQQKLRVKSWQQEQKQLQNPAKRRRPSPAPTSLDPAATRFLPAIQNTAQAAIPIVLGPVYEMGAAPGSLYIPAGPPGMPGVQPVLVAPPPGPYQYLPNPSGGVVGGHDTLRC